VRQIVSLLTGQTQLFGRLYIRIVKCKLSETGCICTMLRCSCRGFEWSSFLQNQWICIAWGVNALALSTERRSELIDAAENTFDVAGPSLLVTCFNALISILPKVTCLNIGVDTIIY